MKKIFFSIVAFAAVLTSCSTADLNGASSSVSTTTVSASVAASVAQNFPGLKVVSTTTSGTTTTATLNTGEQVTFAQDGSILSYSNQCQAGLSADSLGLPPALPADSLRKGGRGPGRDDHGRGGRGNGFGPQGHRPDSTQVADTTKAVRPGHPRYFKNEIAVDSLPSSINTYISTNYSGYKVIHAQTDTIAQGVVTEVLVCTTAKEPVKLVFDATGIYLFKAERILYADVPSAVSATVTAGYSTYTAMKRAEKLTLADGSLEYTVFLRLNTTLKAVTFSTDGTVISEK